MKLPPAESRRVRRVYEASIKTGIAVYAVGGCVRDDLLGKPSRDVDLVVDGDAAKIARAVRASSGGSFEAFDRFGTVRFRWDDGGRLDLARARRERYAKAAALPTVRPAPFGEDLKRRDFTINAMARRLSARGFGPLIDPFDGAGDLRKKMLRALHEKSFKDDPTRLFRAARYGGRFGFRPEPETASWMMEGLGFTSRLSRERLRQELWRILEERNPAPAFALLEAWDLCNVIFPDFRYPRTKAKEPAVRLGLCAAAFGPKRGAAFLKSLPFPRGTLRPLFEALAVIEGEKSPKTPLASETAAIVREAVGGLKPAALKPAFLTGRDLRAAGLVPGPEFARILEEAARAQWLGRIATRAGALAWLRRRS
jgi:tRNA nucleotidyltransferase (CCA-adding enzyme)